MGRSFQWEGFPGGKEFPAGKIFWWERYPDGKDFLVWKDFLVGRNSRSEEFPG